MNTLQKRHEHAIEKSEIRSKSNSLGQTIEQRDNMFEETEAMFNEREHLAINCDIFVMIIKKT